MLGTARLLLALAVAASHAKLLLWDLNPGVISVICFYLISGYVMSGLIRRHYSQPSLAWAFYADRTIRLLPQYLFYACMTLVWHLYSQTNTPFLARSPSSGDLLNNLLIVPLNYYMFNGSDLYTLIPPAWSLGAELQFYILAPFLLLWPKRLFGIGLIGLAVYLAALSGVINSDWFGYRLLPGVLLFFVLGACLQHQHQNHQHGHARSMTVGVAAAVALGAVLLNFNGILRTPYNFETMLGLILGLALLQTVAKRTANRWDSFAGDISYGVFLNHFLILWTVFPQGVTSTQWPVFLAFSVLLSWLSQRLIEQPLIKLRHRFRKPLPITRHPAAL